MESELFNSFLAHLVLEDLTRGVHGELLHEVDVAGHLVPCHAGLNVVGHFSYGHGVLFLQKERAFSLEQATQIIAFSAVFGVLGTVLAGWLSDRVFRSDRIRPAILSGAVSFVALALFLYAGGGYVMNILYVSVFSLSIGVLYCIVAGLMAVDIVPRKATGAALGIVGISSYVAAGLQDITSGYLIQYNTVRVDGMDVYDFGPVSYFWLAAALVSFILPVMNWKKMKNNQ